MLRATRPDRPRAGALCVAVALLVATLATSCDAGEPSRDAVVASEQLDTDRRVLLVSVDGLRSSVLRALGPDELPTLARLQQEGAGTLEARTVVEQTETLPDHTSMVTGRRIATEGDAGGHGVTWNSDRPDSTVQDAAGGPVGSVFQVVQDAGGSTALFTGKSKFSLFDRSWPGSLDRFTLRTDGSRLVTLARRDLREEARALTFLHLAAPDRAGHEHGWSSPEYADAVRRVDRWLGEVLRTVEESEALAGRLTLVLTSDHGGRGDGHGNPGLPANYRIPFLTWGAGVAAGEDLYALNDDYLDPGRGRPGYDAERQPVRNADVANLALDLLDLGAIPASTVGTAQSLDLR